MLGTAIGVCAGAALHEYKSKQNFQKELGISDSIAKNPKAIPTDTFPVKIIKDTIYKTEPEIIKFASPLDSITTKSKALVEQGLKNLKKIK